MAKLSLYDQFLSDAKASDAAYEKHREAMRASGSFDFLQLTSQLKDLQNKLNNALLMYWFSNGENDRFVQHIVNKFLQNHRNLLAFLFAIDSEMRFFILHQLKTNDTLFAHC